MPRSLGGGDEANILMAHARCNAEKKNRMPTACELLYRDFIYEARPNGKSIQF